MKLCNESPLTYDITIFGLGYESRAVHFLESFDSGLGRSFALGYTYHNELFSYEKNKEILEKRGSNVLEITDAELGGTLQQKLLPLIKTDTVNVLVDLTSMSRHRVTSVIWFLLENLLPNSTLRLVYSPSKYLSPPENSAPVKYIGPAIKELSGSLGDLDYPTTCIATLGYEENKALGAINNIDPAGLWLIIPNSKQEQFKIDIFANNKALIESVRPENCLEIDIHDPKLIYRDLKSLLLGSLKSCRPLIIPLGPKIFAAIAVILANELKPLIPVWRVSSYEKEEPVDRKPSGDIIDLIIEI